jgi:glycosyltransferase involved in cell wall biosynthesis
MDEKKVSVIYNGINLIPKSRMKPIKDRAKQRQVNIGMVAHLVPQKRHSDFISAAKLIAREVPGSKFFIIGAPYPSHKSHAYANKLRRIAKATRINKRLVFTGFISNTLKAISELDLVVLPSTDEGASNVIMEAMMLSKPLVAYESGSNSEFIENRVGGLLVPSKDYRRLASAAIKICKDKELAIQMGNAAREKAQKLFDIRNTALSYAALYKRVRKANRF